MKVLQFITHPIFVIFYFMFILISGEHLGGFYLLYLLLALPHGGIHAVLGFLGIGILVLNYSRYKNKFNYLIEPILNIVGAVLLIGSLFSFFYNDVNHYNYSTFYQTVPLVILILFLVIELIFMVKNFIKISSLRVAT